MTAGASSEEQVALVDADGTVVGSSPRSRMRRENLRHASTGVLVRRGDGAIYVHQRSAAKDWAPSHHDAAAGGVLRAGEQPVASARRELAEELGIEKATLRPLLRHRHEDDSVRCVVHVFEARHDGPVQHRDGEVVSGEWLSLEELGARLRDPDYAFVPDTRAVLARLSRERVGDYARLGEPTTGARGTGVT